MVQELIDFYQQELHFKSFYSLIMSRSFQPSANEELTNSDRFLSGIPRAEPTAHQLLSPPNATSPHTRIDVPVWFGSPNEGSIKILVFGSEPRDTDKIFNIEVIGKHVYASPFGADRWNPMTSIPRKPQLKYFRVFERLITHPKVFIVFSDIVKGYEVTGDHKGMNDREARRRFKNISGSESNLRILSTEIEIIRPREVLLLGNDAFGFMKSHSELSNGLTIHRVRHPSHAGESQAKRQTDQIARGFPK